MTQFIVDRNVHRLFFAPFNHDESADLIKKYLGHLGLGVEEEVIDIIQCVSCFNPRYIAMIKDHISIATSPSTSNTLATCPNIVAIVKNFRSTVQEDIEQIYTKAKAEEKDLADKIIASSVQQITMTFLGKYGLAYRRGQRSCFTDPFILNVAYAEKGLSFGNDHWHSLEQRVPILLQMCNHEVFTKPKNPTLQKNKIIPRTLGTYTASTMDESLVYLSENSPNVYQVVCAVNQKTFDIVVVDKISNQVFFVQVSKSKYANHTKPTEDYGAAVIEQLNEHHTTNFKKFYVYATIRPQNYTLYIEGNEKDIYFMDLTHDLYANVNVNYP